MEQIRKDIKTGQFHQLYLLHGEEDYLRRTLKNELKHALVGEGNSINYAYYEGKDVTAKEVIDFAKTLPFLAEHRVVIVENCVINAKFPKEWKEYLEDITPTTIVILVEKKVDGRSALKKTCAKYGYVADLNEQKEAFVIRFVADWLALNHCQMERDTIHYFIGRVSNNLGLVEKELEKLRDYVREPDMPEEELVMITAEDVKQISNRTEEDRIFDMVDAAVKADADRALSLYHDLLALKMAPAYVLAMLNRQINLTLQVKDHLRLNHTTAQTAKAMGLYSGIVGKIAAISRLLTYPQLKELFALGVQLEEDFKSGRITDRMAVDIMISKCANP